MIGIQLLRAKKGTKHRNCVAVVAVGWQRARRRGHRDIDLLLLTVLLKLKKENKREDIESRSIDRLVVDLIHETQFNAIEPG
jgi:hypothetical protein